MMAPHSRITQTLIKMGASTKRPKTSFSCREKLLVTWFFFFSLSLCLWALWRREKIVFRLNLLLSDCECVRSYNTTVLLICGASKHLCPICGTHDDTHLPGNKHVQLNLFMTLYGSVCCTSIAAFALQGVTTPILSTVLYPAPWKIKSKELAVWTWKRRSEVRAIIFNMKRNVMAVRVPKRAAIHTHRRSHTLTNNAINQKASSQKKGVLWIVAGEIERCGIRCWARTLASWLRWN